MKTRNMTIQSTRNSICRSPLRLGLRRLQRIWITRVFVLIALAFGCFALSPAARAVLPAPDGGYPNRNTAEGEYALFHLTTGGHNTAIGYQALFSNTYGNANTANGAFALSYNTTGNSNTATGYEALSLNTTGNSNTATGLDALFANRTGNSNTATGESALYANTTGSGNTATGESALYANTTGIFNTATGLHALSSNTTGNSNTANGVSALFANTTGNQNTANGYNALVRNTAGYQNTANGVFALNKNTTGNNNTATGVNALLNNTTGNNNTANGVGTLRNTTGSSNIALGFQGGLNLTTGNNNIDIGNTGVAAEASTIRIGTNGSQTKTFIAGIRGVTTVNVNAVPVVIDSVGQLGTISSSARFKKEIKRMDSASEAIHALKPVTFHYKTDTTGTLQFGLIAEEVAQVNPGLIVRDDDGKPYTVRYDAVNAMLLNEFLKEHRRNEEQEVTIAQLKSGVEALTATVKEQAAQLQKVSAQIEVSRPAPQVVNNNQ
jgi:hypothetical protein